MILKEELSNIKSVRHATGKKFPTKKGGTWSQKCTVRYHKIVLSVQKKTPCAGQALQQLSKNQSLGRTE